MWGQSLPGHQHPRQIDFYTCPHYTRTHGPPQHPCPNQQSVLTGAVLWSYSDTLFLGTVLHLSIFPWHLRNEGFIFNTIDRKQMLPKNTWHIVLCMLMLFLNTHDMDQKDNHPHLPMSLGLDIPQCPLGWTYPNVPQVWLTGLPSAPM